MTKNIILCGVGGQGTVLASRLISSAAMARDIPVLSAETIGMAQRGGSVFSHVRMSTDEVLYSPMIAKGEADLIIAFEPGEAVRQLPFLKPDGRMVVSSRPVMPVTAALSDTGYGRKPCWITFLPGSPGSLLWTRNRPCRTSVPQGSEPDPPWRCASLRRSGPGSRRSEGSHPPEYKRKIPRPELQSPGVRTLNSKNP